MPVRGKTQNNPFAFNPFTANALSKFLMGTQLQTIASMGKQIICGRILQAKKRARVAKGQSGGLPERTGLDNGSQLFLFALAGPLTSLVVLIGCGADPSGEGPRTAPTTPTLKVEPIPRGLPMMATQLPNLQ